MAKLEKKIVYSRKRLLLFHGYPQYPDAFPERPWWRFGERGGLIRCDGVIVARATAMPGRGAFPEPGTPWTVWADQDRRIDLPFVLDEDRLAVTKHVDKEFPLAPPEPLMGQVWINEDDSFGSARRVYVIGTSEPFFKEWPPRGAVLVYGPSMYGMHVPWGPPEWTEEEEDPLKDAMEPDPNSHSV